MNMEPFEKKVWLSSQITYGTEKWKGLSECPWY